jgi:hypothetical protein
MGDGGGAKKDNSKKGVELFQYYPCTTRTAFFMRVKEGERGTGRGNRMGHIKRDMHNIVKIYNI